MEVQYNPNTGTADIVRGSDGIQRSNHDSAYSESHGFGTVDEVEAYRLQESARGLGRRASERAALRGITDQDLDEGRANPAIAALELQLSHIQQQLYSSNNPVEQAKLAAQAQQLAEQIVTGRTQGQGFESDDLESFADAIRAEHGPLVDEVLQNAAQVLDESTAAQLNSNLESGDPEVEKATWLTLKQLRETPEHFNTDRSSWSGMSLDQESRLAEHVGAETASQVHLISNLIAAGKLSSAQALAQAAKSPALLRAFRVGLEQGVFSHLMI